ncbi:jg25942, partial [Pararge aegeria aegeria]
MPIHSRLENAYSFSSVSYVLYVAGNTVAGRALILGNIAAQGQFMFQEPLVVSDANCSNDKGKELHVFLFQQCVIFAEAVGKKTQFTSPTYNYKAHVL